ncbi:MAG: ferredoxin--NADP reductase [Gemmataceae bacterium]|nr:ferredoxin--NADP reductase [Gemmataceae bacterium]
MTPEQIADLRRTKYNASVVWIHKTHPDLMRLRVALDGGLPPHKPGQYTSLGLGNWEPRHPGCQEESLKPGDEQRIVRRAYSIGCPILGDDGKLLPGQGEWLEFYIVLVRESEKPQPPALTPRLFMLRPGDRLNMVEKITGHYTLDPVQPGDTVLFLSTGTGEAPHNYMIWELLHRGHTGRILSACCVRFKKDLAYLSTHEELMRRYPNYVFMGLTTREADTMTHKIYIQDLIASGQLEQQLGQPLDPAHTHVYLCGNPKMIGVPEKDKETGVRSYPKPKGVIEILEQRGFKADQHQPKVPGNIHFEEYW